MHLGAAHRARRVRADRLEHVLDRDVRILVAPGRDRAVVKGETGQVEPGEGHHGGRDRLVAADEADEAVEQVASHDELDRVGDHLARDERRAHALGSHRDAVGDGDRVELHRRPAGVADAPLDVLGERALVQVARHRLDPARRDADERPREVLVGEAGALQHRARAGAVGAVGERSAVALGGIGRTVVRVLGHVRPGSCGGDREGETCSSESGSKLGRRSRLRCPCAPRRSRSGPRRRGSRRRRRRAGCPRTCAEERRARGAIGLVQPILEGRLEEIAERLASAAPSSAARPAENGRVGVRRRCRGARPGRGRLDPCSGITAIGVAGVVSAIRATASPRSGRRRP